MREKQSFALNSAAAHRMRQIAFVLDARCRDVAFGRTADPAATRNR